MLEKLKFNFSFIGLSETWATIMNQYVLNITNYNHEQCIRTKKRKVGGQAFIYTIVYSTKREKTYHLQKYIYMNQHLSK